MCCLFLAEAGIRDYKVTGVQTCALPIFSPAGAATKEGVRLRNNPIASGRIGLFTRDSFLKHAALIVETDLARGFPFLRSEERRGGKGTSGPREVNPLH